MVIIFMAFLTCVMTRHRRAGTLGLFTRREVDPSTSKILESGIILGRVYTQKFRHVSCPSREG